jgi:hypothetical protein
LGALTAFVSVLLVIGAPLFALWVASRIQTEVGLTMAAAGATVGALILTTFLLYKALTRLTEAYEETIGRTRPRGQLPWNKPVSGERRAIAARRPLSAIDWIVVGTVVVTALAFAAYFFFA